MKTKLPISLVIIILTSLVIMSCSPAPIPQIGEKAPDFSLQSIEGKSIRLSDYQGKKVVLFLWSRGCTICLETEMPYMQTVYDSWPTDDLVILAINDDNELKTVQDIVKSEGYTYNFLLDPEKKIRKQYGFGSAYPLIISISPDGTYKKCKIGDFQNQQERESWFESL